MAIKLSREKRERRDRDAKIESRINKPFETTKEIEEDLKELFLLMEKGNHKAADKMTIYMTHRLKETTEQLQNGKAKLRPNGNLFENLTPKKPPRNIR